MHRVVILGCGFAGLSAAGALRRAEAEVVVVDRTNHHLFQTRLYQVATGVLPEGDIALPIRDVLRRRATRASSPGPGPPAADHSQATGARPRTRLRRARRGLDHGNQ